MEEAIEEIDIGGPTLLRAAAKNFASVTVVVDPDDYMTVIEEMKANEGATTLSTRFSLAKKVFALTHEYDGQIYHFLSGQAPAFLTRPPAGRPERSFLVFHSCNCATIKRITATDEVEATVWHRGPDIWTFIIAATGIISRVPW